MNRIIYIGVDDTDTLDCGFGTGRIARGLAKFYVDLGLATSLGVSRHQLLVHPDIRYTSHNSSKGLAVVSDKPEEAFYQPGINYMKSIFVPGSDPGLCICPENKINQEILDYAVSCQTGVILKEDSIKLAAKYGIWLKELGGDGGGIIGALSAVGLRAAGNDGRLVECRGANDITGILTVADLKHYTDVYAVHDVLGALLPDMAVIDSRNWIKPDLVGGRPVLHVRPAGFRGEEPIWETLQAKKPKAEKNDKKAGQHDPADKEIDNDD